MKKTCTINLSGRVFHIDEDAFIQLNNYLDAIKAGLQHTEGASEIYDDIENRIAELLNDKLRGGREVVSVNDIDQIIGILGQASDISGNEGQQSDKSKFWQREYRRMYRDTDRRILGGVCSGMAAYWQIDPTLVRVIFILLAIFGMAGVIIYLILWVVVPEANTVAQKLEMQGKQVTLTNIIDFFKDEFENVKRSFQKK